MHVMDDDWRINYEWPLSPYTPANGSGQNQPSAGLCLQLENLSHLFHPLLSKMNSFCHLF